MKKKPPSIKKKRSEKSSYLLLQIMILYIESPNSSTTNKASGGDGIPVELFQILKDDAVKVLNSRGYVSISMSNMEANVENSAVATGLDKVSFHSNP